MTKLLMVLTVLLAGSALQAQDSRDSVKAAVRLLFEGMKTADAGKIKAAFADSAVLQTIVQQAGGATAIRNEKVEEFAELVGRQAAGDLDERIEFAVVETDGPLATVWTPYRFYYKGSFSHCGVNSFQLVRLPGGWKIQYLIDTRRKDGCK